MYENMENLMGERISYKRKEKGLTMEELGKLVGVNKSAVNKWEKGMVKNLKQSTIKQLAEIFDCSPVWLMGIEENNNFFIETNNENGILIDGIQFKPANKCSDNFESMKRIKAYIDFFNKYSALSCKDKETITNMIDIMTKANSKD